ncbi:MAG TPA: hypothetical protein DCR14_00725 [Acidimicrobiaceae bacterium]|nr:hypothetical protein [Acidimicrobiaceae bacterium]
MALGALLLPLGLSAGACSGGLTDSPIQNTTTTTPEVFVVEGRPLRLRSGRLHRARSRRGHSHITDRYALWLAPDVRAALADHWRDQAELEHASVVAFHDLARRLEVVDAPDHLIRGALHAAEQEADHAGRCFDLAARYLGVSLRPGRLRRPRRLPRPRTTELANLAVEALRDGVVNEGYAAWLATARIATTTDHIVRATLEVIAHDEQHHADLSAAVLAWCLAEGGAPVHAAVHAAAHALPDRMVACVVPAGLDRKALASHGYSDPDPDGSAYRTIRDAAVAALSTTVSTTLSEPATDRRTTGRQTRPTRHPQQGTGRTATPCAAQPA